MNARSQPPVIVRRKYPYERDRVFAAFADARLLEQWFSPDEKIQTNVLVFEFCVGGLYRIEFLLADGTSATVGGVFRRIVRPSHISFEWTWEKPDQHAGVHTLVMLEFIKERHGTTVVVTHERLADAAMRARHTTGWDGALDRLSNWFSPQDIPEKER